MTEQKELNETFSHAYDLAKKSTEVLVHRFLDTEDFEELVSETKIIIEGVKPIYPLGNIYLSLMITDRLSNKACSGNKLIIECSKKVGIKPENQYKGERLKALSCLIQALSM